MFIFLIPWLELVAIETSDSQFHRTSIQIKGRVGSEFVKQLRLRVVAGTAEALWKASYRHV